MADKLTPSKTPRDIKLMLDKKWHRAIIEHIYVINFRQIEMKWMEIDRMKERQVQAHVHSTIAREKRQGLEAAIVRLSASSAIAVGTFLNAIQHSLARVVWSFSTFITSKLCSVGPIEALSPCHPLTFYSFFLWRLVWSSKTSSLLTNNSSLTVFIKELEHFIYWDVLTRKITSFI